MKTEARTPGRRRARKGGGGPCGCAVGILVVEIDTQSIGTVGGIDAWWGPGHAGAACRLRSSASQPFQGTGISNRRQRPSGYGIDAIACFSCDQIRLAEGFGVRVKLDGRVTTVRIGPRWRLAMILKVSGRSPDAKLCGSAAAGIGVGRDVMWVPENRLHDDKASGWGRTKLPNLCDPLHLRQVFNAVDFDIHGPAAQVVGAIP